MSYIEEMLEEILKLVYREYREIVEIERLSCVVEETLNHSDRKSANLILEMRQSEMERVSQAKRAISELLENGFWRESSFLSEKNPRLRGSV